MRYVHINNIKELNKHNLTLSYFSPSMSHNKIHNTLILN